MDLNPLSGVAKEVMGGLDGLFTSDDERMQAEQKIAETLQKPHILQAMANLKSADHPSVFVAGARPALLWICAAGIAWSFVLQPFAAFMVALFPDYGVQPSDLPELDTGQLLTLVLSLLGLGGLRTREKEKGVARDSLK